MISEDKDYFILVFKVNVGQSYLHKVRPNEKVEEIPLRENYDSVFLDHQKESKLFQMEYQLYNADNVVLTHIIKTRIEVEENQVSDENAVCKFCQAKAEKYCENCQEYFCQTCDDLAHGGDEIETHDDRGRIINTLRTQHTRVAIADARPYRFGKCSNQMSHRNRQNEYYDKKKNQAYCTECAIEIA